MFCCGSCYPMVELLWRESSGVLTLLSTTRSVLRIDLRAENGDVSAAEEIQSGIELRKMRINFGSMVRSSQLYCNRSLAFGWPEVGEPARPA